jgi:hypothetical protein
MAAPNTLAAMPGFVPVTQKHQFFFRGFVYGEPKAGKSVFCGSWPAPILLHPYAEGGYDTFLLPDGSNLFAHARLGEEHHLWLQAPRDKKNDYRRVSDEVRTWLRYLSLQLDQDKCEYKTIILGGFNVLQEMIFAEGEFYNPSDGQKTWGYVAKWATELLQSLCSFPAHVLIECGANIIDKDRKTNTATKWAPAVAGKAYNSILAAMNVIAFQYKEAGRYYTSVAASHKYVAGSRLAAISYPDPVQNACYDTFAYPLGLPPIHVADPSHPRARGMWPWPHQSF